MRRLAAFLRSVLPGDRAQLLLLCGSVFLYVSSQLRFWPVAWNHTVPRSALFDFWSLYSPAQNLVLGWIRISWVCRILLEIAGSAGLFLCLWPGRRPFRNLLLFVCTPGLWAVGVICVRFLLLARNPMVPVTQELYTGSRSLDHAISCLWQLGPGPRFAMLGLVLIGIFVHRLKNGRVALPVELPPESILCHGDDASWRRIWVFIWFSCTFVFALFMLIEVPVVIFYAAPLNASTAQRWIWLSYLVSWVGAAAFAYVAARAADLSAGPSFASS